MPVTARLSKLFYDRLGEEIVQEMVDWFNAVDATYRSELREQNELNFSRFEAKLEQRISELDARLTARIDGVETRLTASLNQGLSAMEAKLERRLGEQTRWLFVTWASLLIPIIGLWMRP